jgi:DNA-binding response OmpR family regulator
MQKLLVVDDEPGVRESIRFSFSENFEVYTTASVAEAVTVVAIQRFDIIILDLALDTGRDDGLKVLRAIRYLDPGVAVIILTAYSTLESAQEAIRLGADDYLTKPFDVKMLRRRVVELVDIGVKRRQGEAESARSLKEVEHLLSGLRQNPDMQKQKMLEISLLMIQAAAVAKSRDQNFERLDLTEIISGISYVLTGTEMTNTNGDFFILGNKLSLVKMFFRLIHEIFHTGDLKIDLTRTRMDVECKITGRGFVFQPTEQVLPLEIVRVHEGEIFPTMNGVVVRLPLDFSAQQSN